MTRYIVTCTPPTPNGDLHLGHLSGPFLAAEVCQRTLRQAGHDVLFVSYADDYQSYVPRKTMALERDPVAFTDLVRRMMMLSLEAVDIRFDHFLRAFESAAFERSARHYLDVVADDLERRKTFVHVCPTTGLYGYEAFGRGECNWCGASSDASQCENCARKPIPEKMKGMRSIITNEPMELTELETTVWSLGRHYAKVAAAHAQQPVRSCLRDFLADVLANENDTWSITRPGDAGLPIDTLNGEPLHTWFMGLSGYRATVDEYLEANPERGTLADWWAPDTKMVHFLGYDCSYSHAVAYCVQQVCDASGPPVGLFLTNRFLKLDGDDFSTSRGNAIWIKDIAGQYPSDAVRLYAACFSPETEVKNFELAAFKTWVDDVYRPLSRAAKTAAAAGIVRGEASDTYWAQSPSIAAWTRSAALDGFSIAGMADAILGLAREIEAAPDDRKPAGWAELARIAAPICPNLASTLSGDANS
ncbi:MAG TPA: methionine--tRNA ligase [Saliniramus sp.]|nr:methionine--tRNA ligase [Saliniramus sp.]